MDFSLLKCLKASFLKEKLPKHSDKLKTKKLKTNDLVFLSIKQILKRAIEVDKFPSAQKAINTEETKFKLKAHLQASIRLYSIQKLEIKERQVTLDSFHLRVTLIKTRSFLLRVS